MWTHSDVAVLLKAVQTANLLQDEEFSEPQPGIEAMSIAASRSGSRESRRAG